MLYLLHSTRPVGTSGRNSASHYLGWTTASGLPSRLALHRAGRGARLTRAFRQAGAQLLLALAVKDGSREMERRLKSNGHLTRLCPLCNPTLAVLGAQVTLEQLSLALKWSGPRSPRRRSATGGVSSATNTIRAAGTSPPGPRPESSTSFA